MRTMYCTDAQVNDRVELHPGTDRWAMGDRYGVVVSKFSRNGMTHYRVKLDKSGRTITFPSFQIADVIY